MFSGDPLRSYQSSRLAYSLWLGLESLQLKVFLQASPVQTHCSQSEFELDLDPWNLSFQSIGQWAMLTLLASTVARYTIHYHILNPDGQLQRADD